MSPNHGAKVSIVDYGISNLFSVKRACEYAGIDCVVTSDNQEIKKSKAVILPGVGAFGDAMKNLKKRKLISPIKDFILSGKPFLGICLGMQLLMDESEEFGSHKGLGVVKGNVVRFPKENSGSARIKVPHIGWNRIRFAAAGDFRRSILKGVGDGEYMYFTHSYFVETAKNEHVITTTEYSGVKYCSGLRKDNVFAFQFHPEKSGVRGLGVYKNFAEIVNNKEQ